MALGLVGKAGRGLIWVRFLSVISQETPIPPTTPGHEAAQLNQFIATLVGSVHKIELTDYQTDLRL